MKQIVSTYTFSPGVSGAGTVTLSDFSAIQLNRVLLIIDSTVQRVIYDPTNGSYGGTVSGNTLTLEANTSDLNSGDSLSIWYDNEWDDPDYQSATLVDNEIITWKRNFNTSSLSPNYWTSSIGTGATITFSGGQLNLAAGTTANSVVSMQSVQGFTLPFRIEFTMMLSQRIANNSFYLELVNQAGNTFVGWLFDGTTATLAKATYQNGGNSNPASPSGTFTTITTATTPAIYELDCRADEVDWLDSPADSGVSATARTAKTRSILDPDELYYVRIRSVNGAVAPASSTTMTIEAILVQDTTKHTVEIAAGRGNNVAGKSVPVTISQTAAVSGSVTATAAASAVRSGFVAASGLWQDDTVTNLGVGATFTGVTRDLVAAAANAAWVAATYAGELRISAMADVVGTLYLEVSRDNFTTAHRVKAVTLTQAAGGAGMRFYGEIIHRPSMRYARAVFINGAGAQTVFALNTIYTAI